MTEEKQIVLNKIDKLLAKRTAELQNELPDVHEVDDGIIIRFFTEWDNCADDEDIKFKKIINHDNPDEVTVFFYIPKDSRFELKQRFYIGCLTCLNGSIDITANNKTVLLESSSKICPRTDEVEGIAYENTYLVVTSERSNWSDTTKEHLEQYK